MIDRPSVPAMWSPTMRAIVSVEPPAANGTTKVMFRSGKSEVAGFTVASRAIVAMTDLFPQARGSFSAIALLH
jgi:hypothetical protein